MRNRGGGVGHRVFVDPQSNGLEEEAELEEEEPEEGYRSNEDDLEDEVLHYGYEHEYEDDEEGEGNHEREIPGEYGGKRQLEQVVEEEEEMRGDLGPEDGEAEDEHDGYFGYAPL